MGEYDGFWEESFPQILLFEVVLSNCLRSTVAVGYKFELHTL